MTHFKTYLLCLGAALLLAPGTSFSQCFVEGANVSYTPNPSNTISQNGTEWVKLYIHVCERYYGDPTLSDAEVENIVQQANADFSAAGIQFFYCLDRRYNPDFTSGDAFGMPETLQPCTNDDGIDVFLMPSEYDYPDPSNGFNRLYGGGFSFLFDPNNSNAVDLSIPGQEIIIWGKITCRFPYNTQNMRTARIPHFLSHELGHVMGLMHTHEEFLFGPTLLDNSNCAISGDLVCDTKPAKSLEFCVDFNPSTQTCEELNHAFAGEHCDFGLGGPTFHTINPAYAPDLNNIMAYTNYEECTPIFTAGQNARMMATLQNNSLLQNFRYKLLPGNVVINSVESWPRPDFPPSGNVVIGGDLIIEPGAYLFIQSGRVALNTNGKVLVKASGNLQLAGGTLTSNCTTWRGVDVKGNAGAAQSQWVQGYFEVSSNGSIENAVVGANSTEGGIIYCNDANFRNNYTGVNISSYNKKHTISAFNNTRFSTDPCDKFGDVLSFTPRSHMMLTGVLGDPFLRVNGCSFSNSDDLKNPTWFGIWSVNSDLRVEHLDAFSPPLPSTFRNLSAGIYQYFSNDAGLRVDNSVFAECGIGLYAYTPRRLWATANTFNLGRMPKSALYPTQFGAWVEGNIVPIIRFERNTFQRGTGQTYEPTVGSLIKNLGNTFHPVKENIYKQLTYGNLANGNNGNNLQGTLYVCNTNEAPQLFDFAVAKGATVRQLQGQEDQSDPNGGFLGSGNTFSYTNGNNGDFSDFLNEGPGQIDYIWADFPNQQPLDFLSLNDIEVNNFACVFGRDPDSLKDYREQRRAYYETRGKLLQAWVTLDSLQFPADSVLIEQKERQIGTLLAQQDETISTVINYEIAHDYRPDTIRTWLNYYQRPEADVQIALHDFQAGRLDSADAVLQAMPGKYALTLAESQGVTSLRNLLALLNTQDLRSLDSNTVATLETLSASFNDDVATRFAHALLAYYKHWYQPDYLLPDPVEMRSFTERKSSLSSSPHLFPNPTSEALNVRLHEACPSDIHLKVFNSQGRLMLQRTVPIGTTLVTLPVADWPGGMYWVRAACGERFLFAEKVLIQH